MRFSRGYFLAFLAVLAIEIFIAIAVRDSIVRPFVGDVLVVVLLYCLVRALTRLPVRAAIGGVFAFACCVELAQWLQLGVRLGIPPKSILGVMLGTHFDPLDFAAYGCGALVIGWYEAKRRATPSQPQLG